MLVLDSFSNTSFKTVFEHFFSKILLAFQIFVYEWKVWEGKLCLQNVRFKILKKKPIENVSKSAFRKIRLVRELKFVLIELIGKSHSGLANSYSFCELFRKPF